MTALSLLIKASILLLMAMAAHAMVARRTSAATRHLIWTIAIAGLLLLPLLSAALPQWTAVTVSEASLAVLPPPTLLDAATSDTARPVDRAAVPTRVSAPPLPVSFPRVSWQMLLLTLYLAGVVVLAGRLVVERLSIRRLAQSATTITAPEWTQLLAACAAVLGVRRGVRLLRNGSPSMPMASGIWSAVILLPSDADAWSDDRRRSVLLHELAHVARLDCLTQALAAVACTLYWVHPGVWWMARRLRVERELACDDCVLAAGTDARDYASHLLDLAYAVGNGRTPNLAVPMAGARQLEGRMLAVLDAARHRAAPARASRLVAATAMVALLAPVAAATVGSTASTSVAAASRPAGTVAATEADPEPQVTAAEVGTWQLRPTRDGGMVYLQLTEGDGNYGRTVSASRLSGFAPGQTSGAVQFSIHRDAGTFAFEGVARSGVSAGTYTFSPSATFPAEMAKRGFERPTPAEQRLLARQDIGFTFVDELASQRYTRPTLAQLIRAAQHGVDQAYLWEMGQLGYRAGQLEALVNLRDHGVDPEYIRGLRTAGYGSLSLEQLVSLRNHGVDPEYIAGLRAEGYRSLDLTQLLNLRSHGIDPEYVRELRALGYRSLSLDSLLNLRGHGVDAEYIREFQKLGYTQLPLDDFVRMRSHGVDGDNARRANQRAGSRLTVDRLTDLASRGWR